MSNKEFESVYGFPIYTLPLTDALAKDVFECPTFHVWKDDFFRIKLTPLNQITLVSLVKQPMLAVIASSMTQFSVSKSC